MGCCTEMDSDEHHSAEPDQGHKYKEDRVRPQQAYFPRNSFLASYGCLIDKREIETRERGEMKI